ASGPVYFRVATADGLVEIGNTDLPAPPAAAQRGVPAFYDAAYFGERLRIGAYLRALERPLSQSRAQELLIQVAETTQSREQFIRTVVRRAVLRDALVV